MRNTFFYIMALAAVCLCSPRASLGCSCEMSGSALEELERRGAVFSGSVIEIIIEEDEIWGTVHLVKFDVIEAWKGVEGQEITVYTASNEAACGYNFQMNKDYLVYANYNNKDTRLGIIGVGLCSRTKLLTDAARDLSELGTVVELITWGAIKSRLAR